MKSHPGDWLWIIAGGRMVAVTPEAYERARVLVDLQEPDVFETMRAKRFGLGDVINQALVVLVDCGELRRELHAVLDRDDIRFPVYAVAPPEAAAGAQQRRAKRGRRKRDAVAVQPPELVLVEGGAPDP